MGLSPDFKMTCFTFSESGAVLNAVESLDENIKQDTFDPLGDTRCFQNSAKVSESVLRPTATFCGTKRSLANPIIFPVVLFPQPTKLYG